MNAPIKPMASVPQLSFKYRHTNLPSEQIKEAICNTALHPRHSIAAYVSAYRDEGGLVRSLIKGRRNLSDYLYVDDPLHPDIINLGCILSRGLRPAGFFEIDDSTEDFTHLAVKLSLDTGPMTPPKAITLDPFVSVGSLRHFIYTVLAHKWLIPSDELADRITLTAMAERCGYAPVESRQGIAFTNQDIGLRRFVSDVIRYDDETIRHHKTSC